MRIFSLIIVLGILCFARENPFEPVENIIKNKQFLKTDRYFHKVDFRLPDSSRVLKKIEVYYQNLNGSISKKTVNIDRKVDWHDTFTLSNSRMEHSVQAPKMKSANLKNKKIFTEEGIKTFNFKDIISFKIGKKKMKIITKDVKIRDFSVDKPYKIVIDFRRDINFLTKSFRVDMPPFVSIVLGNHDKYYRVAIELDGQYVYKLKKEKGDYIITLR